MFRSIGDFRWYPTRGGDPDDIDGVVLGKGSNHNYAADFREAGALLAREVAKPGASSYHQLLVPALFCFRHSLELKIKAVIGQFDRTYLELGDHRWMWSY